MSENLTCILSPFQAAPVDGSGPNGDGVLLTVRTSKTNHEGDAADVRYLKNGAANAIRTVRAADADAAPTDRVIGLSRYRFSAASPPPPAPPASRRA